MPTFYSSCNPPPTPANAKFSPIQPIYAVEWKDGEPFLIEAGSVDTDESIQSHFEEADLPSILARCAQTGNYDLLHQNTPIYGDCTGIPRDYTDAHRKYQQALEHFNSLPSEQRKLYRSFEDFATQIIKNEPSEKVVKYFNALADANKPQPEPVKEVIPNE